MRFVLLTLTALITATMTTAHGYADENIKAIRTEAMIFSLGDQSFSKMQLPSSFKSSSSIPLEQFGVEKFNEQLRSAKESGDFDCIARPTILTPSGEMARFQVGQQRQFLTRLTVQNHDGNIVYIPGNETHQLGLSLSVMPILYSDNRTIYFEVNFTRTDLESENIPLYPITTHVLPSSGMPKEPVLAIKATATELNKGGPHQSPIPFSSLFRFESSQPVTEHYCMAITAKIESLASMPPMPSMPVAPEPRMTVLPTVQAVQSIQEVIAVGVESPRADAAPPAKHATVLKVLLEQYEVACRDGDHAKAKAIVAYCLELDPTCFAKK